MAVNDNCHPSTYYFEWRHDGRCEMLFLHLAKGQSGSALQLSFMRYTQKRRTRAFATHWSQRRPLPHQGLCRLAQPPVSTLAPLAANFVG